jgi:hypothetical protein
VPVQALTLTLPAGVGNNDTVGELTASESALPGTRLSVPASAAGRFSVRTPSSRPADDPETVVLMRSWAKSGDCRPCKRSKFSQRLSARSDTVYLLAVSHSQFRPRQHLPFLKRPARYQVAVRLSIAARWSILLGTYRLRSSSTAHPECLNQAIAGLSLAW